MPGDDGAGMDEGDELCDQNSMFMKKILYVFLCMALAFACSTGSDPDEDPNDDDSPGVDEYFRMSLDGTLWEVEADSMCAAVLADYGTGPVIGLSATRISDTSYITYNIPYFHGQDTTFIIPPAISLAFFGNGGAYVTNSGTFYISRSVTGSLEVYEGSFTLECEDAFSNTPLQITNGSFRLARLL